MADFLKSISKFFETQFPLLKQTESFPKTSLLITGTGISGCPGVCADKYPGINKRESNKNNRQLNILPGNFISCIPNIGFFSTS